MLKCPKAKLGVGKYDEISEVKKSTDKGLHTCRCRSFHLAGSVSFVDNAVCFDSEKCD